MIGFGIGGMLMGRLADRFGVMVPLLIGASSALGIGFAVAGMAGSIWTLATRPRLVDRAFRRLPRHSRR